MKLERSKNAVRNSAFGVLSKLISILLPFAVRTIFIRILGAEYLGLNSLFSSILQVLSLTELGFSSAITFCMYKPIAENDTNTIDALLYFYKKVYFYVGLIILGIGICLILLLPNLINGSYPDNVNIALAYLIYLGNTVISYFLFAYLSSLISAFQREDIISKINMLVQTGTYVAQIIILLTVKNYYFYLLSMPLFTIINNIVTAIVAKKMFPQYRPFGKLDKEYIQVIKEKVSGLIISKICIVSRNAFDSIFISMFLGLRDTTMYNNYYYILNAVVMVTSVFVTSMVAGAGNSVAMESEDKNYDDMNRLNFVYMWMAGWFTACMLCLYQPFMNIWMGPSLMYPMGVVILFCLYFYILKMSDIRYVYELAKGLWWENRYRSITEAVSNLVLNYFLGKIWGVYGIIIATLFSILVINFGFGTQIIFKYYFKHQQLSRYFAKQGEYALVSLIVCGICYWVMSYIGSGILNFMLKLLACMILPNVLYFIIYFRTKDYKTAMPWFWGKVKPISKRI